MLPVLYNGWEREFENMGYGVLADAITCEVTEERNGQYELEMTYPTSGVHFDDILPGRIILAKPNDTSQDQPFSIYKISIPIDGVVTINAEHISYFLSGVPVRPFSASSLGKALAGLSNNSMIENPFSFWTDQGARSGTFSVDIPKSLRGCLGGSEGSILDIYSGNTGLEYEFDRFNVLLHGARGRDNGVKIEYGKNIIDYKQEESIQDMYVGVLAYWKGDAGTSTGKIAYVKNYTRYPSGRVLILDVSQEYKSKPSESSLTERAEKYIKDNNIGTPKVSIDVKFAYLWETTAYKEIDGLEQVRLCDTVTINYPQLGQVSAKAKVVKTVYNTLSERYDSITLGDAKTTLGDAIKASMLSDTIAEARKAAAYDLQIASGNAGGNFMIVYENSIPVATYWMDSSDPSEAVNVIRANKDGFEISNSGIDGTYSTLIGMDGTIGGISYDGTVLSCD